MVYIFFLVLGEKMERRSKESDKIICIEEMAMLANPPNNITSYFSPEFKAFDALLVERQEKRTIARSRAREIMALMTML